MCAYLLTKRVSHKSDNITLRFYTNSASLRDATRRDAKNIAKRAIRICLVVALWVFERLARLRTAQSPAGETRAGSSSV